MPIVAPALLSLSLLSTAPWSGGPPAPMPPAAGPRAAERPMAVMVRTSPVAPPDALLTRRSLSAVSSPLWTVAVPHWPLPSATAAPRLAAPGRTPVHDLYGVAAPHTVDALLAGR